MRLRSDARGQINVNGRVFWAGLAPDTEYDIGVPGLDSRPMRIEPEIEPFGRADEPCKTEQRLRTGMFGIADEIAAEAQAGRDRDEQRNDEFLGSLSRGKVIPILKELLEDDTTSQLMQKAAKMRRRELLASGVVRGPAQLPTPQEIEDERKRQAYNADFAAGWDACVRWLTPQYLAFLGNLNHDLKAAIAFFDSMPFDENGNCRKCGSHAVYHSKSSDDGVTCNDADNV